MDIYPNLIEKLTLRLQKSLPGLESQLLMAPKSRIPMDIETINKNNPRLSSILILLYLKNEEYHTVLIQRNVYPGIHSNQISFPGGKKECSDLDLTSTALRETNEELGIDTSGVKILGKLTDLYIQPSNFLVHPYIGYIVKIAVFSPDPEEVQSVIEAPLSLLLDERTVKIKNIEVRNYSIEAPFYDVYGYEVWGATAMIISEFLTILKEII